MGRSGKERRNKAFEKLFKDEFEDDPSWLYFILIILGLFFFVWLVWK